MVGTYCIEYRRILLCIYMIICCLSIAAQKQQTTEDSKRKAELISYKQRLGFRTNVVDWALTVPNVAVEFDLGNTIRSKRTIGLSLKYNWGTSHKISPPYVLNLFDARVEWRQYFRTRQRGLVTENPDILTRMKEQWFTTQRKTPRTSRAYYWGIYAHSSSYSFKLGKEGKQGKAYGAGLSLGYTAPLYGYRSGSVDFELGGSIGLVYNQYDVFTHDSESNTYAFEPAKSKKGLIPFPVVTDLRVAFVYRFMSVSEKYQQTAYGERRIDRINAAKQIIRYQIAKMRERIDSIDVAVRKQGGVGPDSLLTKEELKEWRLMQKEKKADEEKAKLKALREEVAASLGIVLSDTLTSKQEKAIREEMEIRKKKAEEAAKPVDEEKAKKQAEKEAEKAKKKAEKEAEKAKKQAEKEAKKQKKSSKEKEAGAKEPEPMVEPEKKEEAEP